MDKKMFECFLVVKKGLQNITVHGYIGSARRFTNEVGQYPTELQAMEYMQRMYQSNYSYSHKTNTALGLECYMEFIGNPIRFGRQKKPRPIIKNTLTEAEVTKLIFNCKTLKEKAVITLLAYSGIRNKELCNLKVKDFLIGENCVRIIKGKGLKDGISNIPSECTNILIKYTQGKNQEDYIFRTYQGNQYTTGAVRKLVKIVAQRSKIDKRVYPHLLRHTLAVNMILRGANIVLLQKQLRHSMLETTLTYINSIVFSDRNDYSKFCPSYI